MTIKELNQVIELIKKEGYKENITIDTPIGVSQEKIVLAGIVL
jgi:hypothetical protein